MSVVANTSWYRTGTVSVTNSGTKVTGTGTNWLTAGINPGATFRVDRQQFACEVAEVVSDTEITLAQPFYGNTGSGLTYSIDRNFQSTLPSKLASDLTDLMSLYEQVRDGTTLTIEGKSAYQLAVANGYKGTLAEWLESLKAANEWATLDERTNILTFNNAGAHNSIFRGKKLGTAITDEQNAAIRAGTFNDMYVGDYWIINSWVYVIVHFGLNNHRNDKGDSPWNIVLWSKSLGSIVDDEGTRYGSYVSYNGGEGGFVASSAYSNYFQLRKELIIKHLGEEHITQSTDLGGALLALSSAVDSSGVITAYNYVKGSQIGMLCAHNIWGNIYPFDKRSSVNVQPASRITQFAYFRYAGSRQLQVAPNENTLLDSFFAQNCAIRLEATRAVGNSNAGEIKPIIVYKG